MRREAHSGFEIRRALNGVTFQVAKGETVALVGRNGSGKSTLLSILSRIYLPTAGEARLNGRMMSLLELGAGFDAELTGNQNIFFNGVILGLTEEQVAASYDAILDFAELDRQAMDLPVRMYSSGMQLRLGFAIAVHLDADLLLVDEGLAVGDEGFQEKCFRKMEEFKAQGKTILMVTHELDHVERLADRVLWLDKGQLVRDGDVASVLAEYREGFHLHDSLKAFPEAPPPQFWGAGKENCLLLLWLPRIGAGGLLPLMFPSPSSPTTPATCCGPASVRCWRGKPKARRRWRSLSRTTARPTAARTWFAPSFPTVKVLETGGNIGFGRANNAALQNAAGRYFCLLNSDAEVLPGALAQTLAYWTPTRTSASSAANCSGPTAARRPPGATTRPWPGSSPSRRFWAV